MFAYIDPGAGSLLIQAVVAAIVSVPFFFRRNLATLFRRSRPTKSVGTDESRRADTDR